MMCHAVQLCRYLLSIGCAGVLTETAARLEAVCQSLTPAGEALSTVSAVRCLDVYLERLGALQAASSGLQDTMTRAFDSGQFVNVQPSLLAAVAYRASRERQGVLPSWPTALADLTGWKSEESSDSEFHRALVLMREFVARA